MRTRLRVTMVLLAMLALGWAGGVTTSYVYARKTMRAVLTGADDFQTRGLLWAVDRRVGFTDQQYAAAQAILRRDQAEVQELFRSAGPKLIAIRTREAAELRPLLDERQQAILDEIVRKQTAKANARMGY